MHGTIELGNRVNGNEAGVVLINYIFQNKSYWGCFKKERSNDLDSYKSNQSRVLLIYNRETCTILLCLSQNAFRALILCIA